METMMNRNLRAMLALLVVLSVAGCGGGSDDGPSTSVVYDEAVNGALPFALDNLSPTDLARVTVPVHLGTNIVKGSSVSGEAILLQVPSGMHLKDVQVAFSNHSAGNALVVYVERFPYDGTFFIDTHAMPDTVPYSYTVAAPSTAFAAGNYDLRISTAVGGAAIPNEFTLGVEVVR